MNKFLINDLIELNLKKEKDIKNFLEYKGIEFSIEIIKELKEERIRRIQNSYYVHSLS